MLVISRHIKCEIELTFSIIIICIFLYFLLIKIIKDKNIQLK